MTMVAILVAGFLATTVMTAFSYLLSRGKSKQFREPELLNTLMSRSDRIPLDPPRKGLSGWLLHYLIGWLFAVAFFLGWTFLPFSPGILSGTLMGLAAGFVGVLGWRIMFGLSGNPPEIDFRPFYMQLVVAHVLFGITAAWVFALALDRF